MSIQKIIESLLSKVKYVRRIYIKNPCTKCLVYPICRNKIRTELKEHDKRTRNVLLSSSYTNFYSKYDINTSIEQFSEPDKLTSIILNLRCECSYFNEYITLIRDNYIIKTKQVEKRFINTFNLSRYTGYYKLTLKGYKYEIRKKYFDMKMEII